jgi:hypothetical protein
MSRSGSRDVRPETLPVLFVCGLHRSGTTALAQVLGSAPGVHAMTGTGVPMDEGQHLQRVYPAATAYGGPGAFALHPASALTEASELATGENARRILASWLPYWHLPAGCRLRWGGGAGTAVVLEKSPPNLVRTRFLQRLFPLARFVVVRRHPAVVAVSTIAMRPDRDLRTLLRHWLAAHDRYTRDAPRLEVVHELRYEDLIADPPAVLAELAAAVGIDDRFDAGLVQAHRSHRHWRAWSRAAATLSPGEVRSIEGGIRRYGYSLHEPYVLPMPAS